MRTTFVPARGCRFPYGTRHPIAAAAAALAPARLEVHVIAADDAMLRRLNRDYRRRDRATDVLSFRYDAAPVRSPHDADAEIYVSVRRAALQAVRFGCTLRQEFILLALHGLLHVQGHDHRARRDAGRMYRAELALLARLVRRWRWLDVPPRLPPPTATRRRRSA
jgi:probable rRNA maturation factor